jgi:hypothetical protein
MFKIGRQEDIVTYTSHFYNFCFEWSTHMASSSFIYRFLQGFSSFILLKGPAKTQHHLRCELMQLIMQISITTMESSVEAPQETKNSYHTIQQHHSWAYTQRNVSQNTIEPLAYPWLLQYCSQLPSFGNSSDALQLMNKLRKCDMYIQPP